MPSSTKRLNMERVNSSTSMDSTETSAPPSPTHSRRHSRRYRSFMLPSSSDLASRLAEHQEQNETTPLLVSPQSRVRIASGATSPKLLRLSRHHSQGGSQRATRNHSRSASWGQRVASALNLDRHLRRDFTQDSKGSISGDDRVWYDQFTSTDWVHDNIADAYRLKALRARKDVRGRLTAFFDGSQGWILSALVGCVTAIIAFWVNISEAPIFDFKEGYCSLGWYMSERSCCPDGGRCEAWRTWSDVIKMPNVDKHWINFFVYVCLVVLLAAASCLMTLTTKTVVPSTYRISTLDENLAALNRQVDGPVDAENSDADQPKVPLEQTPPMIYYSASGSGVTEVKVILSGFVLHGFLGLKTLTVKTFALVLSVASGLSLGKEGPFVHIAACVGNIACRLFSKYNHNDGKRREVLSAAAASGVAVAFGAPIGGVLFSLEEASYFFPAKTLFRTFFCCITAALSLKFLNPYGTNKIVMFEVRYLIDWEFFEMVPFIALGILGGAAGALFIKASRFWAKSFRRIPFIKRWPLLEVCLVALITGIFGYWNKYTRTPVAKLLLNLASPCDSTKKDEMGLCPNNINAIGNYVPSSLLSNSGQSIAFIELRRMTLILGEVVQDLAAAFVIKGILTIITFGIKLPAGIYVPSMVVGGLMGRIVGHGVQYIVLKYPDTLMFGDCAAHISGASCVTPGVYALIAGGAVMCGVTRLSVTLAVILFELTGSLDYVLPFSLSVLVAKWTADALEPLSIYDLLTNMNSYPFLNNKTKPVFTSDLADIMPRVRRERIIDISSSPLVPASNLREKLLILHAAGEVDGGLPIIRDNILVGLIPAPDLEFALDSLPDEDGSLCLMTAVKSFDEDDDEIPADPTDFTPYIDPAPIALDIQSPMDLVYECFAKLGLRYICVLREGQYAGMLHRKVFVKYVRELEEEENS